MIHILKKFALGVVLASILTSTGLASGAFGLQLPQAAGQAITTSSPGSPPADLVTLSPKVLSSVVTVICGNSLGSAWAVSATPSKEMQDSGIKTIFITNNHVVEACGVNGQVQLIDYSGFKYSATVYALDPEQDLAGLMTTRYFPTLNWIGSTPAQAWWVGVIGSPMGLPGTLSTGIVSNVDIQSKSLTTSAPLNHGNSGGPIFDRLGRVIAVATAKFSGTEGMGIGVGVPLLCSRILFCSDQIWKQSVSDAPYDFWKFEDCKQLNKIYAGGIKYSAKSVNKGKKLKLRQSISPSIYNVYKAWDLDRDGFICER